MGNKAKEQIKLGDSYRKQIGENIRTMRIQRGYSTKEFAEMVGLSTVFIGLIERGQRGTKFDNLVKLCQIFDCTLSELMSEISIEPYPVNKQRIDPLLEEYLVEHDFSNPHKAKHLMAMIDAGENVFGKVSDRTI